MGAEHGSHRKLIYSNTLTSNSGKKFEINYVSVVNSHREQYKKFPGEVHCRWGYSGLSLDRNMSLIDENGGEQEIGTAHFTKRIPDQFPDDSTKRNCEHIHVHSIIPAADLMNSMETWQVEISNDETEVQRLIEEHGG
jgi:hypothetical protein